MRRFLIGLALLLAACGGDSDEQTSETTEPVAAATSEATTTAAPTTSTTAAPTTTATTTTQPAAPLVPEGFSINLVVTESQCFDTAGALVTVEPELTIVLRQPAPDETVTVVYEVHGGEAVETFSFDLTGTEYSYDPLVISTATCDAVLSARVVDVMERQ